jgi:hypothetical protein
MATETISVDLEAYERLVHARKHSHESFSQVIKLRDGKSRVTPALPFLLPWSGSFAVPASTSQRRLIANRKFLFRFVIPAPRVVPLSQKVTKTVTPSRLIAQQGHKGHGEEMLASVSGAISYIREKPCGLCDLAVKSLCLCGLFFVRGSKFVTAREPRSSELLCANRDSRHSGA